jgi:hypothetical protein
LLPTSRYTSRIVLFAAVPSIDGDTYNEYYAVAYTCYDENNNGKLMLSVHGVESKVIVDNENIFGPVSLTIGNINSQNTPLILYFTYENGEVRTKIRNSKGELVQDITDMIR